MDNFDCFYLFCFILNILNSHTVCPVIQEKKKNPESTISGIPVKEKIFVYPKTGKKSLCLSDWFETFPYVRNNPPVQISVTNPSHNGMLQKPGSQIKSTDFYRWFTF